MTAAFQEVTSIVKAPTDIGASSNLRDLPKDPLPTYAWRPFIGFSFGLYICSLFILPIFKLTPVPLDPLLAASIGGILGVASYFRGKMQADPTIQTDNRG